MAQTFTEPINSNDQSLDRVLAAGLPVALVFENGAATGEVVRPLIAGREKVTAMTRVCRHCGVDPAQSKAYSDSFSDVPMLEAVGNPAAVNPDLRLKRVALARGWPVLNLKRGNHVNLHRQDSSSRIAGV